MTAPDSTRDDDRVARAALSRLTEPGDLRVQRVVRQLGAAQVHALLRDERDLFSLLKSLGQRGEDFLVHD